MDKTKVWQAIEIYYTKRANCERMYNFPSKSTLCMEAVDNINNLLNRYDEEACIRASIRVQQDNQILSDKNILLTTEVFILQGDIGYLKKQLQKEKDISAHLENLPR